MARRARNPLDVSDLLRREPWLTKNEIADRLEWTPESVVEILKELEVARKRDRTHGCAYRYAIQLPRGKVRALELIRKQQKLETQT